MQRNMLTPRSLWSTYNRCANQRLQSMLNSSAPETSMLLNGRHLLELLWFRAQPAHPAHPQIDNKRPFEAHGVEMPTTEGLHESNDEL